MNGVLAPAANDGADGGASGGERAAASPSTGQETTTGAPSSSAAMDAKARREARKARILGQGTDRLARITKTGRGQEADVLYKDTPKAMGAVPQQQAQEDIDDDGVLARADAALANDGTEDPTDVDISKLGVDGQSPADPFAAVMQQQQQQQRGAQSQQQQHEMPQDLQGLMAALQSAMGGGAPGGPGANGQQGPAPGMFPFQQQTSAAAPTPAAQTSGMDIVFNLLRLAVFSVFGLALVYGAVRSGHAEAEHAVAEKAASETLDQFAHMSTLHRWARLAYERPAHWEARYFSMENFGLPVQGVSVFWLFMTLEVGLTSMRIMLHRSRPPPPSLLLKVAAYIPHPDIQLLLRTLASYLPLLDAFVNDVAVVVFAIGCAVMFAAWKVGMDPMLAPTDGAAADVMGAAGFGAVDAASMMAAPSL